MVATLLLPLCLRMAFDLAADRSSITGPAEFFLMAPTSRTRCSASAGASVAPIPITGQLLSRRSSECRSVHQILLLTLSSHYDPEMICPLRFHLLDSASRHSS